MESIKFDQLFHKLFTYFFKLKDLFFFLKCLVKVLKSSSKLHAFRTPCIVYKHCTVNFLSRRTEKIFILFRKSLEYICGISHNLLFSTFVTLIQMKLQGVVLFRSLQIYSECTVFYRYR